MNHQLAGCNPEALLGLKPISIDDLPRYKAAINQTRQTGWDHYFPYLYLLGLNRSSETLIEEQLSVLS